MQEVLHAIGIFISFIMVLVLAYLATRFMGAKFAGCTSGKYIRVVERIFLGRDQWICIINVGSQYYILGITGQNMQLLDKISPQDLTPVQSEGESSPFAGLLGNYLKKFKGEANRDE